MKRHLIGGALMLALVLAAHQGQADTVHGPSFILNDTPTDFRAIGSLTTVDDSNPVNGVGGTFLKIENQANANWSFEIGHITGAPHYAVKPNGKWEFKDVGVQVKGGRAGNIGHIATPHAGEAANALPLATSRRRDIEMGDGGRSMNTGGAVGHGQHFDTYTFEARVTGVQGNPNGANVAPGPPNLLTGGFELVGQHREGLSPRKSRSHGGSFYSDPNGGAWVSYNATTKELTIHPGKINGLDMQGGTLGGVASEFANDAMLGATWTVSPLKLKSATGGVAQFGGGEFKVDDPSDRFSFHGTFESYRMADSTSFPVLQSFAILKSWDIERLTDSSCASPFLERFVRHNLFGDGMSAADWQRWNGIDLAVVTSDSLAKATENFTVSVARFPATIYLTLNLEPEDEAPPQQEAEPEQQQAEPQAAKPAPTKQDDSLAGRVGNFLERAFPGLKEE